MRDEELQRIIRELDSALDVVQRHRGGEDDAGDARIAVALADLRRDLAVYRAISQGRGKSPED